MGQRGPAPDCACASLRWLATNWCAPRRVHARSNPRGYSQGGRSWPAPRPGWRPPPPRQALPGARGARSAAAAAGAAAAGELRKRPAPAGARVGAGVLGNNRLRELTQSSRAIQLTGQIAVPQMCCGEVPFHVMVPARMTACAPPTLFLAAHLHRHQVTCRTAPGRRGTLRHEPPAVERLHRAAPGAGASALSAARAAHTLHQGPCGLLMQAKCGPVITCSEAMLDALSDSYVAQAATGCLESGSLYGYAG